MPWRPSTATNRWTSFVQVSLDGDPARGGAAAAELAELADTVAARRELRLRGVMAVPPMDWEPAAAFAQLARLSTRLRADHPDATRSPPG